MFKKIHYGKKIWFRIPETWILLWRGSNYERGLIILLVLMMLLSASYFLGNFSERKEMQEEYKSLVSISNPFSEVDLEAKVAYVFDPENGELLFSLHKDKTLPIASITKIMTALVALEVLEEDTVISISKQALYEKGDNGLYWDEKWSLADLIKFMLIASSNDAAKAIALAVEEKLGGDFNFIEQMNKKAKGMDLTKTEFLNVTGLDMGATESGPSLQAGAYGSAKDAAYLLAYAMNQYPDIFEATAESLIIFTSLSGLTHTVENTNTLLSTASNIVSSKTGLTNLAGGNLVVAVGNALDNPLIISVLGSSKEGRFSDIEKLMAASALYVEVQE